MIHAVLINRFTLRLMQDDALMNAYAKGDARAFEELYRRHKDGVFSFLRRQCDSFEVCEELAHEVGRVFSPSRSSLFSLRLVDASVTRCRISYLRSASK